MAYEDSRELRGRIFRLAITRQTVRQLSNYVHRNIALKISYASYP